MKFQATANTPVPRWGQSASIFIAVVLLVVGCASPAPLLAPRKAQAIEANSRGAVLFSRGDYAGAIEQYRHALDFERSIENEDGIASNLINLSIAYQRLGDGAAARAAVEEILDNPYLRFPAPRVAEAALRKAILLLEARDVDAASQWLERTRSGCAQADCPLGGKILNVQAQLALLKTDYTGARDAATRALAANRARSDREEIANSLRLLGAALIEIRRSEEVGPLLNEALAIDKDLALPPKIFRDLVLLGRAAMARNLTGDAAAFFRRASAVARSLSDPAALAEADGLLQSARPPEPR